MGVDFGLTEIAAIASIAGTGVSALGAMSQGNAAASEARYNAAVAQNNQTIANQNANYAIAAGEAKAADQGLRERASYGALVAGLAANGLDINSGSAGDLRVSKREVGELDVMRTRADAAMTAYGYRVNASNYGAQAQLDTAKAGFDTSAGFLKAGGDLLSGAGSIGTKWLGLQNKFDPRSVTSMWGGGGEDAVTAGYYR